MGFELLFKALFNCSNDSALTTGVKGAFVEGCACSIASQLTYMSEGLPFHVAALLVANGTDAYTRLLQALNLVVLNFHSLVVHVIYEASLGLPRPREAVLEAAYVHGYITGCLTRAIS
ncbi:unnamed protein product [Peniophora sp. CBMAI 1063]|nr:unnamed protein product [Peniophora sp. CBMAI 1063]